ncbi:MAG TPA: tail fiber domain-containing protein [Thermoanaerobaculia bacterium]|nr:tail fiber domain-containing protein [Thermoanaerobaculia bacterium]
MALTLAVGAYAKNEVGRPSGGGSQIEWQVQVSGHERITLRVLSPSGDTYVKEFNSGKNPSFRILDLGGAAEDGSYNYELRVEQKISSDTKKKLAEARANSDDEAIKKIKKDAKIGPEVVQSGSFTISGNSIVSPDGTESDANDSVSAGSRGISTNARPGTPTTLDQVIPDDLIVQSSTCTGFDCVDGESFGFDTLRLKENNLRIHFEDTSTSAGFPANDWRFIANDSGSGGGNFMALEDSTAARNIVVAEAGAPSNALYVDSTGNIGFQQSAPSLDLHITTSDTPAMRYEQTNAGGFTAQTWDIGANEANFFVRDVTGGSRLSFRIRPGAPTSSIDISADGDVGVGTASPVKRLHVVDTSDTATTAAQVSIQGANGGTSGTNTAAIEFGSVTGGAGGAYKAMTRIAANSISPWDTTTTNQDAFMTFHTTNDGNQAERMRINANGRVGIATSNPAFQLVVGTSTSNGNGAHVTDGGVWTNGSSRTFKENIHELSADDAKAAVAALKPVTYKYKNESEPYVGFIAEEVPTIVAQEYDRRYLSPMDIVATLTKVVQEQQKTIDELSKKVDELSAQK